jgi:large subunit ribosomal protein L31e
MSNSEERVIKENFVVLPLRKAFRWSRTNRVPSAIRNIKKYVKRHFKVSDHQIIISQKLNEILWRRGKKKILRKIRVLVQQTDKQVVKVLPANRD